MINLGKIFNHEPYGCVHTTIGELCVFCITGGDQEELHKELGKPINECEPMDFVRKFIRHICFLKSSLKEGKYKPDKPLLTNDDISSLTENELEAIAKLYIEHNEYLFKKTIWEKKQDDKGETVNYIEYGEIEYPRHENENYTQYLTRLSIKEEEKLRKQMEEMLKGLKSFSDSLKNSIKSTLSWGDSLRKTLESIRPVQFTSIKPIEPKLPNIDWSEIQEARLRPFNELAKRLDKLIDVSTQSTEFMIETNEIQTRIAGEIKSSGDQATKFSRRNLGLTLVVIFLTLINLSAFIYSIIRSNSVGESQRLEIQKHANMLAERLADINNSIITANGEAVERVQKQYTATTESLRRENESLKAQVMEQAKIIDEMKGDMQRQDKKLEELEKNILLPVKE
jgi:DNA-binding ferritin-like protein